MKKFLMFITLGLFLYSASAFAADNDAKQQPRGMKGKRDFLASLNLTDAQKKELGKLKSDMEKRGVELRAKAETARIELRDALMAETPDKAAIEKKMDEVVKREADLRMNKIDGWFETNKLLTPEQQKQWIKALRFGTAREMRQARMQHGPGAQRHPMRHNMESAPATGM